MSTKNGQPFPQPPPARWWRSSCSGQLVLPCLRKLCRKDVKSTNWILPDRHFFKLAKCQRCGSHHQALALKTNANKKSDPESASFGINAAPPSTVVIVFERTFRRWVVILSTYFFGQQFEIQPATTIQKEQTTQVFPKTSQLTVKQLRELFFDQWATRWAKRLAVSRALYVNSQFLRDSASKSTRTYSPTTDQKLKSPIPSCEFMFRKLHVAILGYHTSNRRGSFCTTFSAPEFQLFWGICKRTSNSALLYLYGRDVKKLWFLPQPVVDEASPKQLFKIQILAWHPSKVSTRQSFGVPLGSQTAEPLVFRQTQDLIWLDMVSILGALNSCSFEWNWTKSRLVVKENRFPKYLANGIHLETTKNRVPLPRPWYLPNKRSAGAVKHHTISISIPKLGILWVATFNIEKPIKTKTGFVRSHFKSFKYI